MGAVERTRYETRQRLISQTQRNWNEASTANELKKRVERDTKDMFNDLVYGDRRDQKVKQKVSVDKLAERKSAIMRKQRDAAEDKAVDH